MDYAGLPLSTLLSQTLVAFTVEFDNEFEHRMPHRTTNHGGTPHAPWLVSLAMWSNCMAFVGEDGVHVDELYYGLKRVHSIEFAVEQASISSVNKAIHFTAWQQAHSPP